MDEKATIYDIAKALNISAATVSRALNKNPKISQATRELVFETAAFAPLGQYRNPTALRSNVSGMLQTAGIPVMWGLSKN
jgi:LacI family transcriptional regulator